MVVDVVTLGETMVSMRADGLLRLGTTARVSVAGAESTVAVGLSRLGHRVRWVGRVGRDEPGELVLRTLRAEEVDVSRVREDDDAPTGIVLFEQRLPDVTRVQYYRAGSAGSRLAPADVTTAIEAGTRLVHLSGITPALSPTAREAVTAACDHAAEHDVAVCLDVNFRSRLWSADEAADVLTPLARRARVVVGSPDELALVGGVEDLLRHGVAEVVTKHGAEGAAVTTENGTLDAPAHRVPVVDSVGAGDAFTAGYLSGWLDGVGLAERLDRGTACGAFAVATRGDWEGLPTRAELDLVGSAGTALR
ncbi:sugar kinase [Saccharomonospora azurea SZMC 14600]|nr:sugar kinase [Saccharomonospora azurea SZMC 14600]